MKSSIIALVTALGLPFFLSLCGSAFAQSGPTETGARGGAERLKLLLSLEYVETSKDSNRRLFRAEIEAGRMILAKEYGGFSAPDDERLEKSLDVQEEQRILDFIRNNGLDSRILESKTTEGLGLAGVLRLEVSGTPGVLLDISGKTNIWGTDEYVRDTWGQEYVSSRTNLEHAEWFPRVESLFRFLWNL